MDQFSHWQTAIIYKKLHYRWKDSKDNFLLDLIDFSEADYLVTSDKDLLLHNPFKKATILTPSILASDVGQKDTTSAFWNWSLL